MRLIFSGMLLCLSAAVQAGDLHTLISKTIDSHPDVLVEKSKQIVAQTQLELSQEQYYPTFSVSFENAAVTRDVDVNYRGANNVTTFRLQQPLYTFGRLDAGEAKNAAALESQTFSYAETQLQLAQSVLQAWG